MMARTGQYVSVERVLLQAGERAAAVPADTADTPLLARVSGFLDAPAELGEEVRVRTRTGRMEVGRLRDLEPRHAHDFGRIDPLLLGIAAEVRDWLPSAEAAR